MYVIEGYEFFCYSDLLQNIFLSSFLSYPPPPPAPPPKKKPEQKTQDPFQSLRFHTHLQRKINSFALGSQIPVCSLKSPKVVCKPEKQLDFHRTLLDKNPTFPEQKNRSIKRLQIICGLHGLTYNSTKKKFTIYCRFPLRGPTKRNAHFPEQMLNSFKPSFIPSFIHPSHSNLPDSPSQELSHETRVK